MTHLVWASHITHTVIQAINARPAQDTSDKAALQRNGLLAKRGAIKCGVQQLHVVILHTDLACMPQLQIWRNLRHAKSSMPQSAPMTPADPAEATPAKRGAGIQQLGDDLLRRVLLLLPQGKR